MGRRKKAKMEGPILDWEISYEMQINGRHVEPGTELKIQGERGRFRFIKRVTSGEISWIDVWGGPKQGEQWRSFREEKVVRVHYKNITDKAMAEEYKTKKKLLKSEEH